MTLLDSIVGCGRAWAPVGELYEVTKKPRDFKRAEVEAVPFATMDAIPSDGSFEPRYALRAHDSISSGTYFERGDVLVAKITPSFENGKQAFVSRMPASFGYATTEVIPLHARNGEHDPRLLFYYLLHPDVRAFVAERMEGSTGRQRVVENVLLGVPMPLFDVGEQSLIVSALEATRYAAAVERSCEGTARSLKQATMRTLFARGLRGEPQKESEIGPVPESWDVAALGAVREWLQYGTSVRCGLDPIGSPVLRIPNVASGRIISSDLKYATHSQDDIDRYHLEVGDLLFIRTNGVVERLGDCAVYEGDPTDALFASYLIRCRLDRERAEPKFVAHFFGSELGRSIIAGRATPAADGKFNLNTGTIDGLPIPLPPSLDEQREIAMILDALDRKIDLHRRKRAVLDELFKSLLHKLMTGEMRVTDLNLDALTAATPAPGASS